MQYLSKKEQDDFDKVKVWEYSETWNNPFGDDDETQDDSEAAQVQVSLPKYDKKKSKSKDKKKKRRKKKVSREESSQADSLLSSILSESELEDVERMNKVGMLIDCSHTGDQTALDTIEHSTKPIVLSHIGMYAK